jgi:hypothetical protein
MAIRNRSDEALTNLVTAFPDSDDEIMSDFLPPVPVEHMTDFYYGWSKSRDLELLSTTPLGDDDKIPEKIIALVADQKYQCQTFAVQAPAGRISTMDAAPQLNYKQRLALAAARALRLVLRQQAVNNTLRDSNQITTVSYASDRQWDNPGGGNSTPIVDLEQYVNQVENTCGKRPNRIGMVREVATAIRNHPDTIDRIKANKNEGIMGMSWLEEAIDVPKGTIKLYNAQYRAVRDGQATTASGSFKKNLGPDVLIAFVEPPSLEHAGLGVTFAFGGFSPDAMAIVNAYDDMRGALGTDYQRAVSIVDFHITNSDAGLRLAGVVDTTKAIYKGYLG